MDQGRIPGSLGLREGYGPLRWSLVAQGIVPGSLGLKVLCDPLNEGVNIWNLMS